MRIGLFPIFALALGSPDTDKPERFLPLAAGTLLKTLDMLLYKENPDYNPDDNPPSKFGRNLDNVAEFYDAIDWPEYNRYQWSLFNAAVSGSWHNIDQEERERLVTIFEKQNDMMQDLYDWYTMEYSREEGKAEADTENKE
jgi:hypothetical protein